MIGVIRNKRTIAGLLAAVIVLGTFGSISVDAGQRRRHHSRANGAIVGGIIGAVGGGLIGGRTGAVIGAGLGSGTGYLVQRNRNHRGRYYRGYNRRNNRGYYGRY